MILIKIFVIMRLNWFCYFLMINCNFEKNTNMKVGFSKTKMNLNLFLAICWTIMAFINIKDAENLIDWKPIFYIILMLLYWVIIVFQYMNKYFEIDENSIVLMELKRKKIDFKDLTEIKYFGGDYIFKDNKTTITITKSQINKDQIESFEQIFNTIKLKFENSNL